MIPTTCPGYFRRYGCMGSSNGDCDRSLGPGGFCSLGSTTSTRGPRISLSIASDVVIFIDACEVRTTLQCYLYTSGCPQCPALLGRSPELLVDFPVNISVRPDGHCQFHGCLQFLDHCTAMTLDQHRHLHQS